MPPISNSVRAPFSVDDLLPQLQSGRVRRVDGESFRYGTFGRDEVPNLQLCLRLFGQTKQGHVAVGSVAQGKFVFADGVTGLTASQENVGDIVVAIFRPWLNRARGLIVLESFIDASGREQCVAIKLLEPHVGLTPSRSRMGEQR